MCCVFKKNRHKLCIKSTGTYFKTSVSEMPPSIDVDE
jgi:hypothetical protein